MSALAQYPVTEATRVDVYVSCQQTGEISRHAHPDERAWYTLGVNSNYSGLVVHRNDAPGWWVETPSGLLDVQFSSFDAAIAAMVLR